MITKIVSGGQTGVDRAALDVAIELQILYGGWCPKGRIAENGTIPSRYAYLQETRSSKYLQRTEWNVRDSDATLIICWGEPSGGTATTIRFCKKHEKPYYIADLLGWSPIAEVVQWLGECRPSVLNVAGPRASKHPAINVHKAAVSFVKDVIWNQPR